MIDFELWALVNKKFENHKKFIRELSKKYTELFT